MRLHLLLVWAGVAFGGLTGFASAQSPSAVAQTSDPTPATNDAKLLQPASRLYFPSQGQEISFVQVDGGSASEAALRPVFPTFVLAGEIPSEPQTQETPAEKKPFDFFYYLKDGDKHVLSPSCVPASPVPR